MKLSDYQYHVPDELIAQFPANPRDSSRLMVLRRDTGTIEHHHFRDLPKLLDESYVIVMNNSRVVNCKLVGFIRKTSAEDSKVENLSAIVYLLKQVGNDIWEVSGDVETMTEDEAIYLPLPSSQQHASASNSNAIVGRFAPHPHDREEICMAFRFCHYDEEKDMEASIGQQDASAENNNNISLLVETLKSLTTVPLPPYVKEETGASGYQTIYASKDGSVAAPTAGLHFTEEVFAALAEKKIAREEVTLHVGLGTFGHVHAENVAQHLMQPEAFELSPAQCERINGHLRAGKKILAVGTTSTRLLESRSRLNETKKNCNNNDSAEYLLECLEPIAIGDHLQPLPQTNYFIHPPYQYKIVRALLTNFHMPELTPVMLVAAFAGYELTMKAYAIAVKEKYRFYSFGDSMLIL
jgi:S-adenosylmethionine:tRNA ribosyltransferase-isomerase